MASDLTFYHSPQSRSVGILILLEELGVEYNLKVIDMRGGENLKEDYLKVNPMGKVPAIVYKGTLVTEQVAIYIFLADLFQEKGFAPQLDDPVRGAFLRWMAFYGSSFEPAIIDLALKREPGPRGMSPYGTAEDVMKTLKTQLQTNTYITGETFTAADILWGTALKWIVGFGLVPPSEEIQSYLERVGSREGVKRALAKDAELNAELPSTKAAQS